MSRRLKVGIMIGLLFLAVGFAAVTTTLVINGTLSIGPDGEGFDSDIIFSKAKISDGRGTAFISADGKSLNFTAELMELGKDVSLRYDITNKNRQYDATGTVSCDFVDETNAYNGYITIEEVPDDFTVKGGTKTTGYVNVRLVRSFAGDETVDSANVEFKCVIKLEAEEREELAPELPPIYTDANLNGTDPVLTGGLVPISLTNDGKVIYADMYNKWYDYSTKRWANAVLLEDGKEALYDEGDVIKEEDIKAYFVWIPRYRYKLWNVEQADGSISETPTVDDSAIHTIEIEFESKNVEPSTGTKNGEWLTHPAFTSFDVNGIWVGKFETGFKGATAPSQAINNNMDSTNIIIKPNVYSWRFMSAGNIIKMVYDFNRTLDSHMMKNTEWGAVAYLSHSEYGINGDININNNNNYLTGYSAVNPSVSTSGTDPTITQPYNTEIGHKASTTGNITGVYDMSGGSYERVAGWRVDNGSALGLRNEFRDSKYLDTYSADYEPSSRAYSHMILGDATGEMGRFYYYYNRTYKVTSTFNSWYYDQSDFVSSTQYNWFVRGGNYNDYIKAGIFAFMARNSTANSQLGFRVVLAPQ